MGVLSGLDLSMLAFEVILGFKLEVTPWRAEIVESICGYFN